MFWKIFMPWHHIYNLKHYDMFMIPGSNVFLISTSLWSNEGKGHNWRTNNWTIEFMSVPMFPCTDGNNYVNINHGSNIFPMHWHGGLSYRCIWCRNWPFIGRFQFSIRWPWNNINNWTILVLSIPLHMYSMYIELYGFLLIVVVFVFIFLVLLWHVITLLFYVLCLCLLPIFSCYYPFI